MTDARLRIADADGAVLDERFPLRVTTGGYELDRRFYLRGVRPWSEDDPHLYDVELAVGDDVCRLQRGIRTEDWDPRNMALP